MERMVRKKSDDLTPEAEKRLKYLESRNVQTYLDKGIGECWLNQKEVAAMVIKAIKFFNGSRYISHAACIMPNHVHWLFTTIKDDSRQTTSSALISIMHGLKSYTANQANKILKRTGPFWSREYYDHQIRDSEQFGRIFSLYTGESGKSGAM